jgi:outer membrane protein assembly factor BamD (BamD/ComL family)
MGLLAKLFAALSARGRATALYKRGMEKAGNRDLEGAIADYTAVIDYKRAPPDVVAMALLNRALAYSREHDDRKATADLDRVLSMKGATQQVISAAHEKLHRMKRRTTKSV